MNKEIFYKYDFYVLEQKFPELNFIELLETNYSLNNLVEPFIRNVTDLLHTSIKYNKNIDLTKIIIPEIEDELERFLANEPLYISYILYLESKQNLSKFVFNKFLGRIFKKDGYNDESHVIQNYIHSWLEKKLALNVVHDLRFNSLEVLKKLLEKTEILHGFYIDLLENFPKKWVLDERKEWVDVNVNHEHLLDSIRMYRREYLDSYTNLLQTQSKDNLWEYVQEVTHNSEYTMLNHEYSFISSVLIRADISLWIEFWDNLKLPIIQDCIFNSSFNFTPQLYLQLLSNLINETTVVKSELKVLLFIVAQNYFKASNKLTERFSNYEDSENKNERNEPIFQKGIEQQNEWLEEKKENYKIIIQSLKKKLSNSEIEDWIFSYKPKINSHEYKPNDIYNSEIKLLTETYKEKAVELLSLELQSFNLQKLNFYVEVIREKEDKNIALKLLEAIINYISSDKFFWDRTYEEPYWSALKGLGFIISQQDNSIQKANELISKFKTIHQGWKPSKIDFSPLIKESFIYSAVALLFENESAFKNKIEKEFFFKEFLNHVLTQDRFSQIDNSEYYQMPLHLLFLVANQIFTDVKEYFEQEIIDNYDNLYSLLAILSSDKNPISENSKKILKTRLDRELLLEKGRYGNRSQKDKVQELEKMIETLKL